MSLLLTDSPRCTKIFRLTLDANIRNSYCYVFNAVNILRVTRSERWTSPIHSWITWSIYWTSCTFRLICQIFLHSAIYISDDSHIASRVQGFASMVQWYPLCRNAIKINIKVEQAYHYARISYSKATNQVLVTFEPWFSPFFSTDNCASIRGAREFFHGKRSRLAVVDFTSLHVR